jgi:hypothetical protein
MPRVRSWDEMPAVAVKAGRTDNNPQSSIRTRLSNKSAPEEQRSPAMRDRPALLRKADETIFQPN